MRNILATLELARADAIANNYFGWASELAAAHDTAAKLIEALCKLQRLVDGPVGGVTQEMKRIAMDAARVALKKATNP